MIPDYQSLMLPILKTCAQRTVKTKEVITALADQFDLSDEERGQRVPSGKQTRFSNRVNWAKSYLKQAGLVHYPERSQFAITDQGKKLLQSSIERIDIKFLTQFDDFREFRARKATQSGQNQDAQGNEAEIDDASLPQGDLETPDESLRRAHKAINEALAADLLDQIRNATPQFFEKLIVELLVAMGYGGSGSNAGRALGRSGDGGVDGVIDQDPLGVDQVYVQAKRYQATNNVGAGAIREFSGALNLKNAHKGIFFTSSGYTASAKETAARLGSRIVLIDGKHLTSLMIEYNIGCREEETIRLKKIDEDFFE